VKDSDSSEPLLNGGQGCQKQFWKGTTQGPSQPNLVQTDDGWQVMAKAKNCINENV
jgi:hypothetical protein